VKVMVTGADGLVGKELVRQLKAQNYSIVATDITLEHPEGEGNLVFYYLDVNDIVAVIDAIKDEKPDVIVHMAALVGGKPSTKNPYLYIETNTMGTVNILEAMREAGVKNLIYLSSWSTYGAIKEEQLPITEWTHQHPENPYGVSKVMAEYAIRTYAEQYGFKVAILRCTAIYGPNQTESYIINDLVDCMVSGETFELWGDGAHTREMLYVSDVADAIIKAIEYVPSMEFPWEHFIVGTGKPYKIKHIAHLAQSIAPFELKLVPSSKWVFNQRSNITCVKKKLGWSPKVGVREGLTRCLEARQKREE